MQVTVERIEPSGGPKFQHGFPDRHYRCGFNKSLLDSERTLQWKRTRRAQDNMSPVRERDDSLKKKLLNVLDKRSVPDPFTRSVSRVPNSGLSISSCGQSSAGGTTSVSHLPSRSGSPGTGPGLSTEHSSICSWRYDEFERANTQRVRQLFNSVDELLYEGRVSSRSESLQEECEEWNGHTPHLRILGNQLEPPKQEGVQYICRRESSARTASFSTSTCLDKREDHSELYVAGRSLAPGLWCEQSVRSSSSRLYEHSLDLNEEEEVYEAEGSIEEFLAYDGKEMEEEEVDRRKSSSVAPRGGVPPVSPHACIRDAVADELFDDTWREVVGLLEELLHKYWEKQLPDGAMQRRTLESSSQAPSSQLPVKGHHLLLSRGSSSRTTFLSTCSNNVQVSSAYKINLNGVMTIQAKPLQQRHQGFTERALYDPDDGASMLMCVKTQALRGSGILIQKPTAQRRLPRLSGRVRMFHNLTGNGSQILRGTRLSTVNESLPSPPVSAVQSHRLPQIHSESQEQEYYAPISRLMQLRGRILRGGATSVMHAVNNLPPLREPTLMLESLSRPNTTHTFRSDTPMKRSFTPMDFACNMRTSQRLVKGESTAMGVTGFSMGITSSTASGFLECITPSRRRLPCADGDGGNMPLLGSTGGQNHRKQLSRFPVYVRKKFQPVMQ
ncbi:protein FAM149A isoform X1 [Sinocyclocheilus rhinocerous]|uniref:protein FAM149A isoform X1 n=1 Tax=Sinocyclocheilus rhinocerous TaxID=307959 RepID=UPI0007B7A16B|nr:PREDICTED: protein FAM149A-like isoform X1 [Sinocyclocheilus rhinocerous]XP_016423194.1 PREDICTED: protein FAM149A-like isoform X1 [Sinocyclocheilus rhinocerous]